MRLRGLFSSKDKGKAPPPKPPIADKAEADSKPIPGQSLLEFIKENKEKKKTRQHRFASDYFMKHPRDLSPLLNATVRAIELLATQSPDAKQAVTDVTSLVVEGCSLAWIDVNTHETILKTLARQGKISEINLLLHIECKRLGIENDLTAYNNKRFRGLLAEAIQGATPNGPKDPVLINLLIKYITVDVGHPQNENRHEFLTIHQRTAHENSAEYVAELLKDEKEYAALPPYLSAIIVRLIEGKHMEGAKKLLIQHLYHHFNGQFDERCMPLLEELLIKAAPMMTSSEFNAYMQGFKSYCKDDTSKQALKNIFCKAAAAGNHDLFVKQLTRIEDTGIALQRIQATLNEAAKAGHADLALDLCDDLKNNNDYKSADVFKTISCAAAHAMLNEHYALARALLHRTPVFSSLTAQPTLEFRQWNAVQIKQLFLQIKNPKFCVEIAARLDRDRVGMKENGRDVEPHLWKKQLLIFKQQYGMQDLSNEAFLEIIHSPEMLQWLAATTTVNTPENTPASTLPVDVMHLVALRVSPDLSSKEFTQNDIRYLRNIMTSKDTDQRHLVRHIMLPFYRKPRATEVGFACYRQIRTEVITALDNFKSTIRQTASAKTNELSKLLDNIKKSDTLEKIYNHLQMFSHTSNDKALVAVVDKCIKIFSSDKFKNEADVAHAMQRWDEFLADRNKPN